MFRIILISAAAAALLALSSCATTGNAGGFQIPDRDNGNGGGNGGGNQNENAFEVTVSGGVNPSYTWEGGVAHSVSVMRTDNPGVPVWAIASLSLGDGLSAPITHGTVPAGAVQGIGTELTLTPGVEYRVSIARAGQNDAGWTEFTP